jgi:hypothetical protein
MAKAYSSPMGDIKKALRKVADDSNDPNREAARAALRALGDEDEREASAEDDAEDATRPRGCPPADARVVAIASGRAKALVVSNRSPYAAQLDEQMGLAARQGTRVEGTQLILSSAGQRVKP